MRPSAREYAQAQERGASCRRNGGKATDNPWDNASTEKDRILRDAWADAYWQQDARRRG